MRILFVANRYFPGLGGSEIVQQRIAEGLVEKGHQCTMLVTDFKDSSGQERIILKEENLNNVNVVRARGIRFGKDPFTVSLEMAKKIISMSKDHDLLYIFTYGYFSSWMPALLKSLGFVKTPILFQPHFAPNKNLPSFLTQCYDSTLGRLTVNHSTKILLLTDTYEDFFRRHGAVAEDICIVPPIVPKIPYIDRSDALGMLDKYRIPVAKKYILSLGRVVEYKGIHFLLDAAVKLQPAFLNDIHIIIAGGGDYLSELKKRANKLGIENKVTFTGRVSESEKEALYNLGDIFSLLSYSGESFGVVLVEAMSGGNAILASDLGAIPGVIKDGVHGRLVNPFELNDVVEGLQDVLKNMSKYRTENLKYAEIFTGEYVLNKLITLFSEVVPSDRK